MSTIRHHPAPPESAPASSTLLRFEVVFDLACFYDGNVDPARATDILLRMIEDRLSTMGEFSGYQDVYVMGRPTD